MPRDGNGNYSLPAGNPVVTDTDIETSWANTTLADVATEMTDSLSRSGKGSMTGPFPITDGTQGAPGLTWQQEPTTGLYRVAAGEFRVSCLNNLVAIFGNAASGKDLQVRRNAVIYDVAVKVSGSAIMRGTPSPDANATVVPFYNATPGLGWTVVPLAGVEYNVIVSDTGGDTGGTEDPKAYAQSIPVTGITDPGGQHNHGVTLTSGVDNVNKANMNITGGPTEFSLANHTHPVNGSTGSASDHIHNYSSSGTATWSPRYARFILATLDADPA